jgi:hypothetical protein
MAARSGGGGGGTSAYNSEAITLQSGTSAATGVDPYIEIEYTSPSNTGTQVTTTTKVTGTQTDTLTIERDTVGVHTVQCAISHPIAVNNPASSSTRENSPIWTDKVEFNTMSAVNLTRSNLTYEITQDNLTSVFSSATVNLFVQPMQLTGWAENAERNIQVFAEEEDLQLKFTMAGSAGQDFNGQKGGEGGETVFKYTLLKNVEYTLKLGCTVEPTSSIGRGGGGAYFYEGGRLLVACGGGGAAGWGHRGGKGGGAGVAGENGGGSNGGDGGKRANDGELPASGILPSGKKGGKVESCTTGQFLRDQGHAPCEYIGPSERFMLYNGTKNMNTRLIKRGYKADYGKHGYRHNGGNSASQVNGTWIGGGGAGAYGGESTGDPTSAGGGGSGYTNGSVTIISTKQGGNTNALSQCLIELVV